MERKSLIDVAVRRVLANRSGRQQVAIAAAVEPNEVDSLLDAKDERVVNAVLVLAGLGGSLRAVETDAKRFITKILRAAAWDKRMYAVIAKTGVGKTFSIKASIPSIDAPVAYIRITEASKNSRAKLTYDLYRYAHLAVRKSFPLHKGSSYIGASFTNIEELLESLLCILVIDEAQKLSDYSFEVLRDIYDKTAASIVLLGSTAFADRLRTKRIGDEVFGQFLRRIDDRYELPGASSGDVAKFLAAFGVDVERREANAIRKRINAYGDIDTLARAMRLLAGSVKDGEMTWKNVGAGQVLEAVERISTTMEVHEDEAGE